MGKVNGLRTAHLRRNLGKRSLKRISHVRARQSNSIRGLLEKEKGLNFVE